MINSDNTIGNRTRDLLVCGRAPEPTATQRAPIFGRYQSHNHGFYSQQGQKFLSEKVLAKSVLCFMQQSQKYSSNTLLTLARM
jgi:hypothetical protein